MQTIFIITVGFLIGVVLQACGIGVITNLPMFLMWVIPLNIINVIISNLIFSKR